MQNGRWDSFSWPILYKLQGQSEDFLSAITGVTYTKKLSWTHNGMS